MSLNFKKTDGKCGKVFLFTSVIVIILSEVSTAQRKLDCRKFVFAPHCRGIAAKRDTESHSNNYRFIATENGGNNHFLESQKSPPSENVLNVDGLMGLLTKAISKNIDYDTSSNYLA